MAEEIKRQAEEAAEASMEAESEAGAVSEEETAQDTQTETAENTEQQSDSDASEDCGGQETEDPGSEEPQDEAEDPEADVVDGEYVSADESPKKGTFFRREKDKRDEKIEELTDKVKRQMAEFDNFRKRTEKEKSQQFDMGARSVIERILPVIDNFERGLAQADENSEDPFVQGMEKIYKQMITELESIGVKPIEAEGKEFDPNLHNAVMHCEDDTVGDNIVVQELQKGYTYHDTVVRHSMVKVAN